MRAITRDEIIARAAAWVGSGRPYSQNDNDPESGYRLDCSGYVSMAWHLDPPGLTTVELPELCERVANDDLVAGDVVMIGGPGTAGDVGHVILFERWADPQRTTFWGYEQVREGTMHRVIRFPPSPPYRSYRFQFLA